MSKQVLILNSGSSSIKFRLFIVEGVGLQRQLKGQIEGLGSAAHFMAQVGQESFTQDLPSGSDHEQALQFLLQWLQHYLDENLQLLVGHRVVHGGQDFTQPVLVNKTILEQLGRLKPLAPLHQPHNLAAIEALQKLHPDLPQVACFDTAFHAGHAKEIEEFAIPRELTAEGVRRYGFHGLSYEFIAQELPRVAPELAGKKVIVAHLGNGASLCAMENQRSMDSSMGFSALDGLVMGTRSGSIDAGVLLYLLQAKAYSTEQLNDLLYKQSGLLGVSGISNDMRVLLSSPEAAAKEAINLYVQRIARECGALIAILQGFDGLVFTGGIGENAALIREKVCQKLSWFGVDLDYDSNAKNSHGAHRIGASKSRVGVYVIPTNEELMIAQHTVEVFNHT